MCDIGDGQTGIKWRYWRL